MNPESRSRPNWQEEKGGSETTIAADVNSNLTAALDRLPKTLCRLPEHPNHYGAEERACNQTR